MSANTVLDPEHMTPSQYVGQQSSEGGGGNLILLMQSRLFYFPHKSKTRPISILIDLPLVSLERTGRNT